MPIRLLPTLAPDSTEQERVRLVLSQGVLGGITTALVALLYFVVVRDAQSGSFGWWWLTATGLLCSTRIAVGLTYDHLPDSSVAHRHGEAVVVVLGALSGLVWGIAGTALFPVDALHLHFLAGLILIGMPAGAISSFSPVLRGYIAYMVMSSGVFALFFLASDNTNLQICGAGALLFGAFMIREAQVINRNLKSSLADRNKLAAQSVELKQALYDAQSANGAKTTFLSNISHELRTPLNAIIGFSEMLKRNPTGHQEYPAKIHYAGQSLLMLVDDLLALTRLEAGRIEIHPQSFALPALLLRVADVYHDKALAQNIRFTLDLAPDLPDWAYTDPSKVRQVLLALLSNAFKFSHDGAISLVARFVNGHMRISVRDTGVGISLEEQTQLFERFYRAHNAASGGRAAGAGLGLHLAKAAATALGGDITVSSQLGKGAEFTFAFPLTPKSQAVEEEDEATAISDSTWHILIAEDVEENALLMEAMLHSLGHTSDLVTNGRLAVERLSDRHYDLVLMDCQMPEMTGYEATVVLRQRETDGPGRLPIAAVTAHASAEDRGRCQLSGMDDYLAKPYTLAQLAALLERLHPLVRSWRRANSTI